MLKINKNLKRVDPGEYLFDNLWEKVKRNKTVFPQIYDWNTIKLKLLHRMGDGWNSLSDKEKITIKEKINKFSHFGEIHICDGFNQYIIDFIKKIDNQHDIDYQELYSHWGSGFSISIEFMETFNYLWFEFGDGNDDTVFIAKRFMK